jgi:hypothetical protein
MTKVKEFKKVLLYKNEEGIKATIKQMEDGKEVLNLFILSTERVMKTKFDDDQKIQLKDNAIEFIKETLKNKFPFKEADEKFNLDAMGMNEIENSYHSYKVNSGKWRSFNYFLNEKGLFELEEKENEKTSETFSYYTENQKQNDVFEVANDLVKLFDKAENLGMICKFSRQHINRVCNVLDIEVNPVVNEHRIIVKKRQITESFNNKQQ